MPIVAAFAAALFVVLLAIVLMPLSLIQRYRVGTSRHLARGWIATLNLIAITISIGIFLTGAAVTGLWVPRAFSYSLLGLGVGCALGFLGLALTQWETAPRSLHYTPNRWPVLGITLVVTSRILYGLWRTWNAWRSGLDHSWLAASGAAESLGAGAVVLGYYFIYWAGVRRRWRRHR